MSTTEILFLAFVLGAFAVFMGFIGWGQYYTKDIGRDRAINP